MPDTRTTPPMSREPTTSEINAALARWDGWIQVDLDGMGCDWERPGVGFCGFESESECPDYSTDLNLIHGLEEKLTTQQRVDYMDAITPGAYWNWETCHAPADIRARVLYAICPEEYKR